MTFLCVFVLGSDIGDNRGAGVRTVTSPTVNYSTPRLPYPTVQQPSQHVRRSSREDIETFSLLAPPRQHDQHGSSRPSRVICGLFFLIIFIVSYGTFESAATCLKLYSCQHTWLPMPPHAYSTPTVPSTIHHASLPAIRQASLRGSQTYDVNLCRDSAGVAASPFLLWQHNLYSSSNGCPISSGVSPSKTASVCSSTDSCSMG